MTHAASGQASCRTRSRSVRRARRPARSGRSTVEGFDRLPADGPAILCPNHISFLDSAFLMLSRAAQHQLRRQGRVHGLVEDEVPVPGDGHDPDRPLGRRQERRPRSRPPRRCCGAASCSASSPRAPAAATAPAQGPHRAPPGWRSKVGCPIFPVGIVGTAEIQPPDAKLPKLVQVVHDHDRPPDQARALRRIARATTSPAVDHRRGDVRDPRAHRPGVPQRVRRQDGRRREPIDAATVAHVDDADRSRRSSRRAGARQRRRLTIGRQSRRGPRAASVDSAAWPTITITLPDGSPRSLPAGRHRGRPGGVDRSRGCQGGRRRRRRRRRGRPRRAAADGAVGDHHGRHRRGPPRAAPLDGPRDGPGGHPAVPGAKFSIGPAIEDGFYYDFDLPDGATFSDDDLAAIEARMREIIEADQPFVRAELSRRRGARAVRRPAVQARDHRAGAPAAGGRRRVDAGEVGAGGTVSVYRNTPEFVDLCRGPHVPSTGRLGHFKLRRSPAPTGGATRRARCCSASTARRGSRKAALDEHLHRLEEAEKRDHRKLGARARPAQLPARARRRPRRVAPQGRDRPQADGGLQPAAARARRLRVRLHAAPHQGQPVRDVSGHLDWYADGMYPPMEMDNGIVLPEADELPDALPDLPSRGSAATASCRCGCSSSARSTATSGPARCTACCASAASRRTTATSSAPRSSCRTRSPRCSTSCCRCCGRSASTTSTSTCRRGSGEVRRHRRDLGEGHRRAARGARSATAWSTRSRRATPRSTAEDRHRRARRHRPHVAALHDPVRLQPSRAVRPRVRRRRQRPPPADHAPPRPVRLGRAVLRRAPRALRRRVPDVAGAGAGPGAAGRRRPTRRTPTQVVDRLPRRRASGSTSVEANDQLGKRIRAAKLEKLPYVLVVGDDDVAAGTVGVNPRGGEVERGVRARRLRRPAAAEVARGDRGRERDRLTVLERLWNGWRGGLRHRPVGDDRAASTARWPQRVHAHPRLRAARRARPTSCTAATTVLRDPQRLPVHGRAHCWCCRTARWPTSRTSTRDEHAELWAHASPTRCGRSRRRTGPRGSTSGSTSASRPAAA